MKNRSIVCAALAFLWSGSSLAFSQWGGTKGAGTQMGHEYLTLESAREVSAGARELANTDFAALARANAALLQTLQRPEFKNDFQHPADLSLEIAQVKSFQKGPLASYASIEAWSAAIGQRWVDVMGFGIAKYMNCFDNVPQLPDDIQPDHFLRRIGDAGAAGRKKAFDEGVRRLRKYFAAAVRAPAGLIPVIDASVAQGYYLASRPYFLFGRAVHLLQDSFSSEHTIRDPRTGFQTVQEIKNYTCVPGTHQHEHTKPVTLTPYDTGDVIWVHSLVGSWNVSNVKPTAKAALEATKDLWIAFLQARRAHGANPDRFVNPVIAKWFKLSAAAPAAPTAAQMPKNCASVTAAALRATDASINQKRNACLASVGTLSRDDPKKPPFFWVWGKPRLDFQARLDRAVQSHPASAPR